jgi:hypothetical protein
MWLRAFILVLKLRSPLPASLLLCIYSENMYNADVMYVYHKRGFLNRLYSSFHCRHKIDSWLTVTQIVLV